MRSVSDLLKVLGSHRPGMFPKDYRTLKELNALIPKTLTSVASEEILDKFSVVNKSVFAYVLVRSDVIAP